MREKYIFDMLIPGSKKLKVFIAPVQVAEEAPLTLSRLAEQVQTCANCQLCNGATQVVFGEGNPQAELMFVGEGPGAEDDKQGTPFVGEAGQLLDKILTAAEIAREEIYIANVVKCLAPADRKPQKSEIEACLPYLWQQIKLIQPKIIVCLGSIASQALLGPALRVSSARGTWHDLEGMRVMPMYHPAALLHDPAKKRPTWEDIQKVRDAYRSLK